MESLDLSLIEISGDEDSLLQPVPASAADVTSFDCSPLLVFPSHSSAAPPFNIVKDDADKEEPSCSLPHNNKENLKLNNIKSGTPNLNIESQKMKRRRKGVGYNLRKSLAWDRAFFTEEGVLDSLELSMISGTLSKNGEKLYAIHEDRRESSATNADSTCVSNALETLEEDLFKELSSAHIKNDKIERTSVLKHTTLPSASVASRSRLGHVQASKKAPLPHDSKKSGSKEGAYRNPLAPTSQKRLLNAGTAKVATRNSKIPKLPILKQDSCPIPATTRNTASHLKGNRIAQTDHSAAQKSIGSKRSSSAKTASTATKSNSQYMPGSNKCSAGKAAKKVANPSAKTHSVNFPPSPAKKVSKLPEVVPNKALSGRGTDAIKCVDRTSNGIFSIDRTSGDIANNNNHPVPKRLPPRPDLSGDIAVRGKYMQVQRNKPSGLRMPSPSLKFFSEPKAPVSSMLQGTVQPSSLKCGTSTDDKHLECNHELEQPCTSSELHKGVIHDAASNRRDISQLVNKCSMSPNIDSKNHSSGVQRQNLAFKVPPSDGPEKLNIQKLLCDAICDVDKCHPGHGTSSLWDDSMDWKNDQLISSSAKAMENDHKSEDDHDSGAGIQDSRDSDGNIFEVPHVELDSRHTKQLKDVSGTIQCTKVKHDEKEQYDILNKNKDAVLEPRIEEIIGFTQQCNPPHSHSSSTTFDVREPSKGTCPHESNHDTQIVVLGLQANGLDLLKVDRLSPAFDETKSAICDYSRKEPRENTSSVDMPLRNVDVIEAGAQFDSCHDSSTNQSRENDVLMDERELCEESQMSNGVNILNPGFLPSCGATNLKSPLSMLSLPGPANEDASQFDKAFQSFGEDGKGESCAYHLRPSKVHDQCLEVANDIGKQLQTQYIETDQVVQSSCELITNERLLLKDNGLLETHEIKAPAVAVDINVVHKPPVAEEASAYLSDAANLVSFAKDPKIVGCNYCSGAVREHNQNIGGQCCWHLDDKKGCPPAQNELSSRTFDASETSEEPLEKSKEIHLQLINELLLDEKLLCAKSEMHESQDILNHSSLRTFGGEESSTLPQFGLVGLENVVAGQVDAVNAGALDGDIEVQASHEGGVIARGHGQHLGVVNGANSDLEEHMNLQNACTAMDIVESHYGPNSNGSMVLEEGPFLERINDKEILVHSVDKDNVHEPPAGVETSSTFSDAVEQVEHHSNLGTLQSSGGKEFSSQTSRVESSSKYQSPNAANDSRTSEDAKETMKGSEHDKKQGCVIIRPPSSAAPFSEEWLAAVESAGEEILTLKTGAVQNSPPDKPLPEPSPWSPVKKKSNQVIGPFDCTKFTNSQHHHPQ